MLEYLSSNEEYMNNENIAEHWVGIIASNAKTEAEKAAKIQMLETLFSRDEYKNTVGLIRGAGKIVGQCKTIEQAEAKAELLRFIFENENLKNNEHVTGENLWGIINACNSMEDCAAKKEVLELYLKEPKFNQIKDVNDNLSYVISNANKNGLTLQMMNRYLEEPKLYENQNIQKYLGNLLVGAAKEDVNKYYTQVIDKYLSDPIFFENKSLQNEIGQIIVYSREEEITNTRLELLDMYKNLPVLNKNIDIQNNIGAIVKRHTKTSQLNYTKDFTRNIIDNPTEFEDKYGVENFGKLFTYCSKDNEQLMNTASQTKDINKSRIPEILKSSFIEDVGDDAGGNEGHIDETKTARFIRLLENPKISPYVVKLLNDNFDMDTVSFLAKTKQNFYQNKTGQQSIFKNNNYTKSQLDFAETLLEKGLKKGEIETLVKIVSLDNETVPEFEGLAILLMNGGASPAETYNIIKDYIADYKREINYKPQKASEKVTLGSRTKESIEGIERKIIEQYQLPDEIWSSEDATKAWAGEKYNSLKAIDYLSNRNAPDDPHKAEKVTNQRRSELAKWYEFLETNPEVKNDPFMKLTILNGITSDLLPDNSATAESLDTEVALDVIKDVKKNSDNVSFKKTYSKKLKEKSKSGDVGQKIDFDGVKGTMYTVPQTDSTSPDFEENVSRVKAYSDGTNWCIRSWNAAPYVQKGAMHFFVDEHGLTQVCIREEPPGKVYEIQKRQQDKERPIPYITAIKDFLERNEIKYDHEYIADALAAKPEFDKIKAELQVFVEKHDYKGILEKIGITVSEKPDGTWELSHYSAQMGKFTLNDLGINENDLLGKS